MPVVGYYLDLRVHGCLFAVVLLVLVRVHADVVESKLLLDAILERLPLFQSQAIGFGNHWHHIDSLAQLLQYDDVNGLESVTGGADEVETAVDTSVLDVALALSRELLAKVGAVLVFDVFDNRVPTAVIVYEIAVAGSVDDVETEAHAIFLNNVGDGVNLGGLAAVFVWGEAAFGVDEVGSEDGVDEGRLAETGLACRRGKVLVQPR